MGGGGGGGGGRYIPAQSDELRRKLAEARAKERERLDRDINSFLTDLLARYNERDAELVRSRLDSLVEQLSDVVEVDHLLLGGSVAKHTYVDGLSDVDALVVLDREDFKGKSPAEVLSAFHQTLNDELTRDEVVKVEKGRLAATVTYQDGSEVQLLPALRSRNTVLISNADGTSWKETQPKEFQKQLTKANDRLGGSLVPAIKLFKALIAAQPEQKQITGYHAESLAMDAAVGYSGPRTPKSVLAHVVQHSAERVLHPIRDATGQSRMVDDSLGTANSISRRNVSQSFSSLARRLELAVSLAQWKRAFEGSP